MAQNDQKPPAPSSIQKQSVKPFSTPPYKQPCHSPALEKRDINQRNKPHLPSLDHGKTRREGSRTTKIALSVQETIDAVILKRVSITDQLGAKTEVWCSPSVVMEALKRFAAVYLGKRPEVMLLTRQVESAFKEI